MTRRSPRSRCELAACPLALCSGPDGDVGAGRANPSRHQAQFGRDLFVHRLQRTAGRVRQRSDRLGRRPRLAQQRALANGVVPQQAAYAVAMLLDDLTELLDTDTNHRPQTGQEVTAA